jgi:hypothetical protein
MNKNTMLPTAQQLYGIVFSSCGAALAISYATGVGGIGLFAVAMLGGYAGNFLQQFIYQGTNEANKIRMPSFDLNAIAGVGALVQTTFFPNQMPILIIFLVQALYVTMTNSSAMY